VYLYLRHYIFIPDLFIPAAVIPTLQLSQLLGSYVLLAPPPYIQWHILWTKYSPPPFWFPTLLDQLCTTFNLCSPFIVTYINPLISHYLISQHHHVLKNIVNVCTQSASMNSVIHTLCIIGQCGYTSPVKLACRIQQLTRVVYFFGQRSMHGDQVIKNSTATAIQKFQATPARSPDSSLDSKQNQFRSC
jgi:hypothetical protein